MAKNSEDDYGGDEVPKECLRGLQTNLQVLVILKSPLCPLMSQCLMVW